MMKNIEPIIPKNIIKYTAIVSILIPRAESAKTVAVEVAVVIVLYLETGIIYAAMMRERGKRGKRKRQITTPES
jgi:hypothetical protein